MNGIVEKTSESLGLQKDDSTSAKRSALGMLAYLVAVGSAEITGIVLGVVPSTIFHAILLVVLLSHYALSEQATYRQMLPVLALCPFLRILSLTVPVKQIPQIYWYVMIGLPLFISFVLTARLLKLPVRHLQRDIGVWWKQLLIALTGVPLSVAAFIMLQPQPLILVFSWYDAIIGSAILMIFTGFAEEILFRGMIQRAAVQVMGRRAILYSSCLFACMYFGTLSWKYILFMSLVGLFFGWYAFWSNSIWGVGLAHGTINIGMAFVWPFVDSQLTAPLSRQSSLFTQLQVWLLVSGSLLCLVIATYDPLLELVTHYVLYKGIPWQRVLFVIFMILMAILIGYASVFL